MSNMKIPSMGAGTSAQTSFSMATGAKPKQEKTEQVNEDSGTVKMPEVKVAHSEQEAIRNRIESLREQIKALDEAKDVDADTKRKMKEQITQQISDLNSQLLDVNRREAEKKREEELSKRGTDNSRRFDRYEPSNALNEATSRGMQNVISAQNTIERVEIHERAKNDMGQKVDVLKNEIKLDVKTGAATEEKEEEAADLKAKIRDVDKGLKRDLKDANEQAEPTYITYDGGLLWLEEMRRDRKGAAETAEDGEQGAESAAVNERPAADSVTELSESSEPTVANVKLVRAEDAEHWNPSMYKG